MQRFLELTLATIALTLASGCGTTHSEPASPSADPTQSPSPSPGPPSPSPAPPSTPIEAEVSAWLDRAAAAPHNGMNPQLELPPRLVTEGAAAFQRAITSGPAPRRSDATSALAQHPRQEELRPFWRSQLDSDSAVVRFRAAAALADVHHADDFEPMLRAYLAHPDLHHTMAVRIRDWHDRRAVVALAELLAGNELVAENAAGSLAQSPDVPVLPAEPTTPGQGAIHLPNGAWQNPPSSTVPPYRRWWSTTGRTAFAAECAWWATFAGAPRPICNAPRR